MLLVVLSDKSITEDNINTTTDMFDILAADSIAQACRGVKVADPDVSKKNM